MAVYDSKVYNLPEFLDIIVIVSGLTTYIRTFCHFANDNS